MKSTHSLLLLPVFVSCNLFIFFFFRANKVFLVVDDGVRRHIQTHMNFYDWTQSRKRTILPFARSLSLSHSFSLQPCHSHRGSRNVNRKHPAQCVLCLPLNRTKASRKVNTFRSKIRSEFVHYLRCRIHTRDSEIFSSLFVSFAFVWYGQMGNSIEWFDKNFKIQLYICIFIPASAFLTFKQ